jgi:hypothetical protein
MSLKVIKGSVTVYIAELQGIPSVGAKAIVEGVLKDNTIEQGKAEIDGGKGRVQQRQGHGAS